MAYLSTTYMGLKLKNPLIISSSGFTDSADKIRELARLGAGAVVLKSLFEEQILMDSRSYGQEGGDVYGEADDYIRGYVRENSIGEYLALIGSAKRQVDIPVIASVNCVNAGEWVGFAEKIAGAGADALEVNVFMMPSDLNMRSEDIERVYFQIAEKLLRAVRIPVAMKIGAHFSGMAHMIVNLSLSGISGLVLFNRFYSPDIDLETLEMTSSSVFSNAADISAPLRWIGMLSGKAGCDMVASTGVHDGYGIAKVILAGAQCAQVATALYQHGMEFIPVMLDQLDGWMRKKRFTSVDGMRGRLRMEKIQDPSAYERAQFIRYFSRHG